LSNIEYVYIPYNKELKKYNFEELMKKRFTGINFKFLCLNNDTRGAAETVKISLDHLDEKNDMSVMCIDSDNFYTADIISMWNGENMVFTFDDFFTEPIFSYVKVDEENRIINIQEKNKISNNACCGIYCFESMKKLLKMCDYIISNNIMDKNEFYMSTVIKQMINEKELFYDKKINKNDYHCLGTPLQVKIFCNNFDRIKDKINCNLINGKRYCFDLDGILIQFVKSNNDYSAAKPLMNNIRLVRYLKGLGNIIIINAFATNNTIIKELIYNLLDKNNIPYDEINFGRPRADYYVGNLSMLGYQSLEKELGYHMTNIDPRNHNIVEEINFEFIKKTSNNLEGEIFYYRNIPEQIKELFPVLDKFDLDNKWYQIEKINGIPISKIYLSNELTASTLKKIMNNVRKIQSCKCQNVNDDVNIYANYSDKLKKRFESYDYRKFKNSDKMFESLICQLDKYEREKKGKITVIHGDPVFTNILIDQYSQIRFIDMNGKLGSVLTIFGDWLYDWAKMYQSLIGYDEILDDVYLDSGYKKNMIEIFEAEFLKENTQDDLKNLKLITKSLLFSLIPLHDNDKCFEYYDLIDSYYLI
jgi:hypothetical protein